MDDQQNLRAIEAVILRMRDKGHSIPDISNRIDKKPGTVKRMFNMIEHKSDIPVQAPSELGEGRPIERVIARLREEGETYGEIGNRLKMSGRQVKRIEQMSEYKS